MKVTPLERKTVVTAQTTKRIPATKTYKWWKAKSKEQRKEQLLDTVEFLRTSQNNRHQQAAIFARLYGNVNLHSFIGSASAKIDQSSALPNDRPTFNLVQSATDTLVSRISQARPAPVFLTDGSDYKQRNLAKKLNNFILGEFHQTKTYEKTTTMLRDALVEGTGCLKVYETPDHRVGLDRVFLTELFVDMNEARDGDPRQLYQVKMVDRDVLIEQCEGHTSIINDAESAYADNSTEASKTVSDLVIVVEGWRLPSAPGASDGRHTIACSSGIILDEEYTKDKFPFVFMHYSPRLTGFWAQSLSEQLMGTQMEINALLYTISKAIKLTGVPRTFVEASSKVTKSHMNNDVGVIIEYRGTKPIYEVAPCVPEEMYAQLQRLIDYGYQQCGVSMLAASSQKPAGLNSGEAIRSYDDISTDRFASLAKRYDNVFIDLAYQIVDLAKDIAEREGSYQTVYPGKNGTQQIDLPHADLIDDPFIIQCFNMSSLPRDPAGRMQKITEMIQAGMISIKAGRRLLDYPDLEQIERLANASEERIYQMLDKIIDEGAYTPPDGFLDLALAEELCVQYINLYGAAALDEDKAQMLRDFYTQIQALKQAAQPPAPQQVAPAQNVPQAQPEPLPQSPLVPNQAT